MVHVSGLNYLTGLLSVFAAVVSAQDNTPAGRACTKFLQSLPSSRTLTPSSSGYDASAHFNWAKNTWLNPKCIVSPASAAEVSVVIKAIVLNGAKFAIRSGGHNPNKEWANIEGGVLIDMRNFDQIDYNPSTNTAVLGSGRNWYEVYSELEPLGVTAIGGRVAPVGVGGLLLGGGLSYLTHKYGLGADNVVKFEVVLATGQIVQASANSYADLFRALKGGTSNFGIVTKFTVKTYPIGQVWGGYATFDWSKKNQLLDASADYQALGDADVNSELCVQYLPNNDTIWVNMVYNQPTAWTSNFQPFQPLMPSATYNSLSIRSWTNFIVNQPGFLIDRFAIRTTAMRVDKNMYHTVFQKCKDAQASVAGINGATILCVFQPISENVVQKGIDAGKNSLGLTKTKQMWMGIVFGWNDPADDAAGYALVNTIHNAVETVTKGLGKHLPYEFMSDAGFPDKVIQSYGSLNLATLRFTALKYDPLGIFQNSQPGGFKLYN